MPIMGALVSIGTAMGVTGAGAGLAGGLAVAGTVATVAGAGVSIASAVNQPKPLKGTELPNMPTPANSLLQAQQDADSRRRASILSGGQTQLTPMNMLQPTGIRRTLLGN
jgi:hypothetical protein